MRKLAWLAPVLHILFWLAYYLCQKHDMYGMGLALAFWAIIIFSLVNLIWLYKDRLLVAIICIPTFITLWAYGNDFIVATAWRIFGFSP